MLLLIYYNINIGGRNNENEEFNLIYNKNKESIQEIKDLVINIRETINVNINKLKEMRNE